MYLLPILLMIGCYFIPAGGEGLRILCSMAGLAAGVGICVLYSRRAKRQQRVFFAIERPLGSR